MSTMTDRELLAMAAKAAGNIWLIKNANTGETYYGVCAGEGHFHGSTPQWNPLTDDGDAMRLAVDLNLTVDLHFGHIKRNNEVICYIRGIGLEKPTAELTRLGILEAAAEIGRRMK